MSKQIIEAFEKKWKERPWVLEKQTDKDLALKWFLQGIAYGTEKYNPVIKRIVGKKGA